MLATDPLRDDHEVISRMCQVITAVAAKLESGEDVPPAVPVNIVGFIRGYADDWHHAGEEELLFPRAEARGIPREGGPIGVMLIEHDQARGFTQGMAEAAEAYAAGDAAAGAAFARNARGYSELLLQHVDKENNILYPMCDQLLSEGDQRELLLQLNQRAGETDRFLALVDELEAQFAPAA